VSAPPNSNREARRKASTEPHEVPSATTTIVLVIVVVS